MHLSESVWHTEGLSRNLDFDLFCCCSFSGLFFVQKKENASCFQELSLASEREYRLFFPGCSFLVHQSYGIDRGLLFRTFRNKF